MSDILKENLEALRDFSIDTVAMLIFGYEDGGEMLDEAIDYPMHLLSGTVDSGYEDVII